MPFLWAGGSELYRAGRIVVRVRIVPIARLWKLESKLRLVDGKVAAKHQNPAKCSNQRVHTAVGPSAQRGTGN